MSFLEAKNDITVKITNVSNTRSGSYGQYKILSLKDIDGKKAIAFLNISKITDFSPEANNRHRCPLQFHTLQNDSLEVE